MNNERKNPAESRGIGVGYVTLIMLFAVICLTVLASLSYQAARANDKLNEKSVMFASSYYEADAGAKRLLARLDEAAYLSYESGFFDENFPILCEEIIASENYAAAMNKVQDGYRLSFTEKISNNLELSAVIVFFGNPADGQRYRIEQWKTVTVGADINEGNLGVWNGENLA